VAFQKCESSASIFAVAIVTWHRVQIESYEPSSSDLTESFVCIHEPLDTPARARFFDCSSRLPVAGKGGSSNLITFRFPSLGVLANYAHLGLKDPFRYAPESFPRADQTAAFTDRAAKSVRLDGCPFTLSVREWNPHQCNGGCYAEPSTETESDRND